VGGIARVDERTGCERDRTASRVIRLNEPLRFEEMQVAFHARMIHRLIGAQAKNRHLRIDADLKQLCLPMHRGKVTDEGSDEKPKVFDDDLTP